MIGGAVVRLAMTLLAQEPLTAAERPADHRNVLLITLDTTRRDFLGCYGKSPSVTPVLDEIAAQSIVFDDALATAPLTLPSHTSMLTGLDPAHHGVRDNALYRLPDEARTLAEILKEHGYATSAHVAGFVLDPLFGLAQGFDRYTAPPRTISTAQAPCSGELDAKTIVDQALADPVLASPSSGAMPKSFFLWLHLFDAHLPYAPKTPPKLTPAQAADPKQLERALYAEELGELDAQLARLFAALRQRQLLDTTLVVVTADHGESLHDTPEVAHGTFLYDATMAVPLFLRIPGVAARRLSVPASHVDLAPTLLGLLGIDFWPTEDGAASGDGPDPFDGLDLSPWIADPARAPPDRVRHLESLFPFLEFGWAPCFGVVQGPLKLIRSARSELFDRVADPREQTNLWRADDPRAVALGRRIDEQLAKAKPLTGATIRGAGGGSSDPSSPPVSPEERARLAQIGYGVASFASALPADWASLPDPHDKNALRERFNAAMAALASPGQRQLPAALALFAQCVAEEPTSAMIREQYALALMNAGPAHAAEAATQIEAGLKLDPRRSRLWFARALQALGRGDLAAAQPCFESCLAVEPSYPEALSLFAKTEVDLAQQALVRNDRVAARERFDRADVLLARLAAIVPPESPDAAATAATRQLVQKMRDGVR